MSNLRAALGLLLAAPFMAAIPVEAQRDERPRLVVLVTIDQFRADYLERFRAQLTGGIARLERGASYSNAHHDHAITETAPGHATLLSGRFPRSTGITMNSVGVEDSLSPLLAGARGNGASPRRFVGTTLVDWLRAIQPASRALSVSMKDRAAILPVGRSRADVYWYDISGQFTTSRYYRDSLPGWVRSFNARRMAQRYAGRSWTLLLPETAYPEPDTVAVEGRDNVFPHRLPDDSAKAATWVRVTPFIDEMVLAFALDGVRALSLGGRGHTDLLAISLSATDVIGHRYGPDSREIHDQVLRVDRMLGAFLDSLYRLRDSAHVTVVLTADHGVGTVPELAASSGLHPGAVRVDLRSLYRTLRAALTSAGLSPDALDVEPPTVRADRAAFRAVGANADSAVDALGAEVLSVPGVLRVDRFAALLADTVHDPIARRWSHQFAAGSPVDLVITLTPGSTWGGNLASHGSPYDYDSHVPLLFYGAGVRPGRHVEPVRTVDLAPTLAALLGIRPLERVDGVVLRSALRP